MKTIKKIDFLSMAKFTTALFALFGIMLLLSVMIVSVWFIIDGLGDWGTLLQNAWQSIVLTIWLGIFGFIFGALGALVYNVVAKFSGGLKISLS